MSGRAVVVVANDPFIDYFIPFLESFREHNPELRLIVIPFDGSTRLVRLLAPFYNFEIYDGSFEAVDRLADMLFGENERLRRRLRKLAAFDMDLDEFMYMDTDILVGMDLSPFFGHVHNGSTDLIYIASGNEWVYREEAERHLDVSRSARFSTAMYVSSSRLCSLSDLVDFMKTHRETFLDVRVEPLFDQPLLNFYIDMTGRSTRHARDFAIDFLFSDPAFAEDVRISNGKAMRGQTPVTLCHWSGPQKFHHKLRWGVLLQPYVLRAQERLADIPELQGWRPFRSESRIRKVVREAKRLVSGVGRFLKGTRGTNRILRTASKAWSNDAQLTRMQGEVIGSLIAYRGFAANVLIFGAGHDTRYWSTLNTGGKTLVIEDDATWAKKVRKKMKSGSIVLHTYPTTVEDTLRPDGKKLADFPEPPGIADTRWDIILIDGPAGYQSDKPGRSLPIYWAHKYSHPHTHIFVDDYERPLEREYCDFFFGKERDITLLPSHGNGKMFWRIGNGSRDSGAPS
jgi:hypothetical protein